MHACILPIQQRMKRSHQEASRGPTVGYGCLERPEHVCTPVIKAGRCYESLLRNSVDHTCGFVLSASYLLCAGTALVSAGQKTRRMTAGAEKEQSDRKSKLGDLEEVLRTVFRDVLQHHHPLLREKFDTILELAEGWCVSMEQKDFDVLEQTLEELKPDEAILVRALCGSLSVVVPTVRSRPQRQMAMDACK